MEALLTVDQLADVLQVSRVYVYKLVRERKLPAVRIGKAVRFTETALEQWLKEKEAACTSNKSAGENN